MKYIIICVSYYFAMTRSSVVSLKGEKESYLICEKAGNWEDTPQWLKNRTDHKIHYLSKQ